MKNVTITGNINITGFSASIPILSSIFVGQITDPTRVSSCKSDLAYNVKNTAGSTVSVPSLTSFTGMVYASDLTQYRKAVSTDHQMNQTVWNTIDSQIVTSFDSALANSSDVYQYYIAPYNVFMTRAFYLNGDCDYSQSNAIPPQVRCQVGGSVLVITGIFNTTLFTEVLCQEGEFYDPIANACNSTINSTAVAFNGIV
jgi:hypothetical protein